MLSKQRKELIQRRILETSVSVDKQSIKVYQMLAAEAEMIEAGIFKSFSLRKQRKP